MNGGTLLLHRTRLYDAESACAVDAFPGVSIAYGDAADQPDRQMVVQILLEMFPVLSVVWCQAAGNERP